MFDVANFLKTIPVIIYGMGGIYIVIGFIMVCVAVLCKMFPADNK